MDLRIVLFLFSCVFLMFVDDACGHPKSWLSTTTRRPRTKPKPKRRPKRSLGNWDVTYYPKLVEEYKNTLKFQELDNFLLEEKKGKDEVASSSLTKKRKESISSGNTIAQHEISTADMQLTEGHPVYEPHLQRTRIGNHHFMDTDAIKENLRRTSGISGMRGIPREVVERLLLDSSLSQPANESEGNKSSSPVDNALDSYPISRDVGISLSNDDVDTNLINHDVGISLFNHDVTTSFLRRLQQNRENRYQVLLNHVLQHQGRISKQNFKFLRNEKESDDRN